ncbi:unnamed protein product [Microthlaspi erraticum]|uniref:MATH domain-containing protein n=1 Tax=Microthlaspi erraticum TaxID=1685480 RepID=A0A6D2K3V0_9BRAS|nr:unnamed protein product [Microthlaspi erraticum]
MFESITTTLSAQSSSSMSTETVGRKPSKAKYFLDEVSDVVKLLQGLTTTSSLKPKYVEVFPKGDLFDDHLSLYLCVANPESLRLGWKRRASFSFVLLSQSGKELFRKDESCQLFCAEFSGWGCDAVPLKKLQEEGFLEKNKLIVKVEIKVVEVVDEGDVTGNETLDVDGFQVVSVSWIFEEHPDFAVNVRPKKTTYINILLGLIETLNKPRHDISETELSNAQSELIDLTEAGFKLDWLETKLDEVSLERKKENTLEEHIKNLTLNKEKVKTDTSSAKVRSVEQTVLDLIDELNKEKHESAAKFLSLEHTVSDLEDVLNMEKDKSDTCAAKVSSLEQTVVNLRAEMNKEKAAACSWEVLDYEEDLHNEKVEYN